MFDRSNKNLFAFQYSMEYASESLGNAEQQVQVEHVTNTQTIQFTIIPPNDEQPYVTEAAPIQISEKGIDCNSVDFAAIYNTQHDTYDNTTNCVNITENVQNETILPPADTINNSETCILDVPAEPAPEINSVDSQQENSAPPVVTEGTVAENVQEPVGSVNKEVTNASESSNAPAGGAGGVVDNGDVQDKNDENSLAVISDVADESANALNQETETSVPDQSPVNIKTEEEPPEKDTNNVVLSEDTSGETNSKQTQNSEGDSEIARDTSVESTSVPLDIANMEFSIVDNDGNISQSISDSAEERRQPQPSSENKNVIIIPTSEAAAIIQEPVMPELVRTIPFAKSKRKDGVGSTGDKVVKVPAHVMGRLVEHPTRDAISNGRGGPQKPRLGVKVPYRNLTSQIVSKQELAEEIMERSRARNSQSDSPSGGNILFARKLTQRLANKLTPSTKDDPAPSAKSLPSTSAKNSSKINDNSDLLAILEGDDEMDWDDIPIRASPKQDPLQLTPEQEKAIALKQLSELPTLPKAPRPVQRLLAKSRDSPTKFKGVPNRTRSELPKTKDSLKGKSDPLSSDAADHKEDVIAEPKFASNLVMKTYTRKPKPTNSPPKPVVAPNVPKEAEADPKTITLTANTYISKSSRVVKKRVIWDPDVPSSITRVASVKPIKQEVVTKSEPVQTEKQDDLTEKKPEAAVKTKIVSPPTNKVVQKTKTSLSEKPKPSGSVKTKEEPEKANSHTAAKEVVAVKESSVVTPSEKPKQRVLHVVKYNTKKVLKAKNRKQLLEKRKIIKKSLLLRKKAKRLTEIDKLLMDEGAVNMLYSVKNTEEALNLTEKQKKRSTISLERAEKDLLNKTNEIKNELLQMDTSPEAPTLRKKDAFVKPSTTPLQRKKSKDSSPPMSPVPFHEHGESSRLIRRHSSSSFSSVDSDSEDKESHKGTKHKKSQLNHSPAKKSKLNKIGRTSGDLSPGSSNKNLSLEDVTDKPVAAADAGSDQAFADYKTISVKQFDNLYQIIIAPSANGDTALSIQVSNHFIALI